MQEADFFKVVEKRRSIRKYKNREVPDEDITQMIQAARLAPSTNNTQPWQFLVVKEPETIKLLSAVAGGQHFIADANTVVMALANRGSSCCPGNPSMWHVQDTMIATEHLVLAATALGYGSCWVAMLDSRNTHNATLVKSALRIPDDVEIVALVTLGVSNEVPSPRSTNDIHQIAFSEAYGNSWK
ncbi:MAG: nitroreductase family protein [Candidatus Thorarchaeota archaeon]|nr:nitroreductase family protein [Candidatus Thorarchaeota archaeon]MCK5239096.1 nitroreductase family protein [Candidatus Thorarchaeota archaeon]